MALIPLPDDRPAAAPAQPAQAATPPPDQVEPRHAITTAPKRLIPFPDAPAPAAPATGTPPPATPDDMQRMVGTTPAQPRQAIPSQMPTVKAPPASVTPSLDDLLYPGANGAQNFTRPLVLGNLNRGGPTAESAAKQFQQRPLFTQGIPTNYLVPVTPPPGIEGATPFTGPQDLNPERTQMESTKGVLGSGRPEQMPTYEPDASVLDGITQAFTMGAKTTKLDLQRYFANISDPERAAAIDADKATVENRHSRMQKKPEGFWEGAAQAAAGSAPFIGMSMATAPVALFTTYAQGTGNLLGKLEANGVDPDVALVMAHVGGFVYGMIERAQASIPGMKGLGGDVADVVAKKVMERAGSGALGRLTARLFKYGTYVGMETFEETGQEISDITTEVLAAEIHERVGKPGTATRPDLKEAGSRVWENTKGGFGASLILGPLTGGVNLNGSDVKRQAAVAAVESTKGKPATDRAAALRKAGFDKLADNIEFVAANADQAEAEVQQTLKDMRSKGIPDEVGNNLMTAHKAVLAADTAETMDKALDAYEKASATATEWMQKARNTRRPPPIPMPGEAPASTATPPTAPAKPTDPAAAQAIVDSAVKAANDWGMAHRHASQDAWFEGAKITGRSGFDAALEAGGERLQAHGMAKEATLSGGLKNLLGLLKNGLDMNRRGGQLDTAPLVNKPGEGLVGATASGSAYSDGPFILVAKPGQSLRGNLSGLGAVLVNEANAELVDQIRAALQTVRPGLMVETYSNAGKVTKALLSSPTTTKSITAAAVKAAADKAATSPANDLAEPTEAQKAAGNYQKGHTRVAGLDISIENPAGSQRNPDWSPLMDHYGYVKGTEGHDGDQVDVFINPDHPESDKVYVVDQVDPKTGKFDEHKAIMGARSQAEAESMYDRNYTPDWKGRGRVRAFTQDEFKAWLKRPPSERGTATTEGPRQAIPTASIPVMITKKMESDLRGRGYTQDAIDRMTPQQANDALTTPPVPAQGEQPDNKTTGKSDDLSVATEPNESLNRRYPPGPGRDAAMAERKAAAVRVAKTLKRGDKVGDFVIDGTIRENGDLWSANGGTISLSAEIMAGEPIIRANGVANESQPPAGQEPSGGKAAPITKGGTDEDQVQEQVQGQMQARQVLLTDQPVTESGPRANEGEPTPAPAGTPSRRQAILTDQSPAVPTATPAGGSAGSAESTPAPRHAVKTDFTATTTEQAEAHGRSIAGDEQAIARLTAAAGFFDRQSADARAAAEAATDPDVRAGELNAAQALDLQAQLRREAIQTARQTTQPGATREKAPAAPRQGIPTDAPAETGRLEEGQPRPQAERAVLPRPEPLTPSGASGVQPGVTVPPAAPPAAPPTAAAPPPTSTTDDEAMARAKAGKNPRVEGLRIPTTKVTTPRPSPLSINGTKGAGIENSAQLRGLYAALARWGKSVADLFAGGGVVDLFLAEEGHLKGKQHIMSEWEPLRAIAWRRITGPTYQEVIARAETMMRGLVDMMAKADAIVAGASGTNMGNDIMAAVREYLMSVPDPSGGRVTAEAREKAAARVADLYESYFNAEHAEATKDGGAFTEAAAKEASEKSVRRQMLRWWAEVMHPTTLAPGQDLEAIGAAQREWGKTLSDMSALAEALSPAEPKSDAAKKRLPAVKAARGMVEKRVAALKARLDSMTVEPPALNDDDHTAAVSVTLQWAMGSQSNAQTQLNDDGSLRNTIGIGVSVNPNRIDTVLDSIRKAHDLLQGADVRRADSWKLIGQLTPGTSLVVDPSYFGKGRKRDATSNYGVVTEIKTPEDLLHYVDTYLLPAWGTGSRMVITNTWDPWTANQLQLRGFNVAKFQRSGKEDELVAWNFQPDTGTLFPKPARPSMSGQREGGQDEQQAETTDRAATPQVGQPAGTPAAGGRAVEDRNDRTQPAAPQRAGQAQAADRLGRPGEASTPARRASLAIEFKRVLLKSELVDKAEALSMSVDERAHALANPVHKSISDFMRAIGREVLFVRNLGAYGTVLPGHSNVVVVRTDQNGTEAATHMVTHTAFHELIHSLRRGDPAAYAILERRIMALADKWDAWKRRQARHWSSTLSEATDETLREEMIADAFGEIMATRHMRERFMRELSVQNRGLLRQIQDLLTALVNRIQQALGREFRASDAFSDFNAVIDELAAFVGQARGIAVEDGPIAMSARRADPLPGWTKSTEKPGHIVGWRGERFVPTPDNQAKNTGATEGVGLYVAKDKSLASQFVDGKPRRVVFPAPKNPILVDYDNGDGLHILHETDDIMAPPSPTDSPWLAAHKEAVRRTGTTDETWGQNMVKLQRALTDVLQERGYDAVHVKAGDEWVVLLAKPGQTLPFSPRRVPQDAQITTDYLSDLLDRQYQSPSGRKSDEQLTLETYEENRDKPWVADRIAQMNATAAEADRLMAGVPYNRGDLLDRIATRDPILDYDNPDGIWPIPVYVSAEGDGNTVGLLLHRDGKKEMFEGNDEATGATLDLVNQLLGVGDKMVTVWTSQPSEIVQQIRAGTIPDGIYVSPSQQHASGYWGEGRELVRVKIPMNRISQESDVDWKVRTPSTPALSPKRDLLTLAGNKRFDAKYGDTIEEEELRGIMATEPELAPYAVLRYWSTIGFTEIANNDDPAITDAFNAAVARLPRVKLDRPIYRFQGYKTARQRDAIVSQYVPGKTIQIRRPVNAFSDLQEYGQELADTYGGPHQIRFVIKKANAAPSISTLGPMNSDHPAGEVVYPRGSAFAVVDVSKKQPYEGLDPEDLASGATTDGSIITVELAETDAAAKDAPAFSPRRPIDTAIIGYVGTGGEVLTHRLDTAEDDFSMNHEEAFPGISALPQDRFRITPDDESFGKAGEASVNWWEMPTDDARIAVDNWTHRRYGRELRHLLWNTRGSKMLPPIEPSMSPRRASPEILSHIGMSVPYIKTQDGEYRLNTNRGAAVDNLTTRGTVRQAFDSTKVGSEWEPIIDFLNHVSAHPTATRQQKAEVLSRFRQAKPSDADISSLIRGPEELPMRLRDNAVDGITEDTTTMDAIDMAKKAFDDLVDGRTDETMDEGWFQELATTVYEMRPGSLATMQGLSDEQEATLREIGTTPERPFTIGALQAYKGKDGVWMARKTKDLPWVALQDGRRVFLTLRTGLEARRRAMLEAPRAEDEGVDVPFSPVRAFHGGPYQFDRFDAGKLGTGEGNHAFGHGLYFASSRDVAEHYRRTLTGPVDFTWRGQNLFTERPGRFGRTRDLSEQYGEDAAFAMMALRQAGSTEGAKDALRKALKDPTGSVKWIDDNATHIKFDNKRRGQVYEVTLAPNEDEWLDWDKPFSQQSEKVKGILRNAKPGDAIDFSLEELANEAGEDSIETIESGGALYRALDHYLGSKQDASYQLRKLGIPGIRYLDEGSRGAGKGTSNYVVFDDSLVTIEAKFSPRRGEPWVFSRLLHAVETFPAGATKPKTGQQWKSWIGKMGTASTVGPQWQGGISKEEIDWLGINDWLQDNKRYTREQVAAFLRENQITLKVTTRKDGPDDNDERDMAALKKLGYEVQSDDGETAYLSKDGEAVELTDAPKRVQELARRIMADGPTQYVSRGYVTPGGTNHREITISMPPTSGSALTFEEAKKVKDAAWKAIADEGNLGFDSTAEAMIAIRQHAADWNSRWNVNDEENKNAIDWYARSHKAIESVRAGKHPGTFTSSHFPEPNIVVHYRVNDRDWPSYTQDQVDEIERTIAQARSADVAAVSDRMVKAALAPIQAYRGYQMTTRSWTVKTLSENTGTGQRSVEVRDGRNNLVSILSSTRMTDEEVLASVYASGRGFDPWEKALREAVRERSNADMAKITVPKAEHVDLAEESGTITPEEAAIVRHHRRLPGPKDGAAHRTLHIDEIQSDWMQKGRDKGFKKPVPEAELAKWTATDKSKWVAILYPNYDLGDVVNAGEEITKGRKVIARWSEDDEPLSAVLTNLNQLERFHNSMQRRGNEPKFYPAADQATDGGLYNSAEDVNKAHQRATGRTLEQDHLIAVQDPTSEWIVYDSQGRVVGQPPKTFNKTPDDALATMKEQARAGDVRLVNGKWEGSTGAVPDAPFKEAYAMLGFKHALRYAVDSGHDRITWTVGQTQIDRYNEAMRQNVDRIEVTGRAAGARTIKNPPKVLVRQMDAPNNGMWEVVALDPDRGVSVEQNHIETERNAMVWKARIEKQYADAMKRQDDGTVYVEAYKDNSSVFGERVPLHGTTSVRGHNDISLEDVIGKELATKVRAAPDQKHEFTGTQLSIGGHGMKEFYDVQLPAKVQKYVAKWGGKVEKGTLDAKAAQTGPELRPFGPTDGETFAGAEDFDSGPALIGQTKLTVTTPRGQQDTQYDATVIVAANGVSLISPTGTEIGHAEWENIKAPEAARRAGDARTVIAAQWMNPDSDLWNAINESRAAYGVSRSNLGPANSAVGTPVWSLNITPAMRRGAKKSQPMLSPARQPPSDDDLQAMAEALHRQVPPGLIPHAIGGKRIPVDPRWTETTRDILGAHGYERQAMAEITALVNQEMTDGETYDAKLQRMADDKSILPAVRIGVLKNLFDFWARNMGVQKGRDFDVSHQQSEKARNLMDELAATYGRAVNYMKTFSKTLWSTSGAAAWYNSMRERMIERELKGVQPVVQQLQEQAAEMQKVKSGAIATLQEDGVIRSQLAEYQEKYFNLLNDRSLDAAKLFRRVSETKEWTTGGRDRTVATLKTKRESLLKAAADELAAIGVVGSNLSPERADGPAEDAGATFRLPKAVEEYLVAALAEDYAATDMVGGTEIRKLEALVGKALADKIVDQGILNELSRLAKIEAAKAAAAAYPRSKVGKRTKVRIEDTEWDAGDLYADQNMDRIRAMAASPTAAQPEPQNVVTVDDEAIITANQAASTGEIGVAAITRTATPRQQYGELIMWAINNPERAGKGDPVTYPTPTGGTTPAPSAAQQGAGTDLEAWAAANPGKAGGQAVRFTPTVTVAEAIETGAIPQSVAAIIPKAAQNIPLGALEAWSQGRTEVDPSSIYEQYILRPNQAQAVERSYLTKRTRTFMDDMNLTFRQLVEQHYSDQKRTKTQLANAIRDELGLKPFASLIVANAVDRHMEREMEAQRQKSREAFKKMLQNIRPGRNLRRDIDELIRLVNLGVMERHDITNEWGKLLGIPAITPEILAGLATRAEAIKKAPDAVKQYAVAEMIDFIEQQMPADKWRMATTYMYANLLSGHGDDLRNVVGNLAGDIMNMVSIANSNWKAAPMLFAGTLRRMQGVPGEVIAALKGEPVVRTAGKIEYKGEMKFGSRLANLISGTVHIPFRMLTAADMLAFKPQAQRYAEWFAFQKMLQDGVPYRTAWRQAIDSIHGTAEERARWLTEANNTFPTSSPNKRRRAFEDIRLRAASERAPEAVAFGQKTAAENTLNTIPENAGFGIYHHLMSSLLNPRTGTKAQKAGMRLFGTWVGMFSRIATNMAIMNMSYMPGIGAGMAINATDATRKRILWSRQRQGLYAAIALFLMDKLQRLPDDDDDEEKRRQKLINPPFAIYGAGPVDTPTRNALRKLGWSPYTVKIGERYWKYQVAAGPLAFVFTAIGVAMDHDRGWKLGASAKTDALGQSAHVLMGVVKAFTEMSFLSGVSQFFTAIANADLGDKPAKAVLVSQMNKLFPASAGARTFKEFGDANVYETDSMYADMVKSFPFAADAMGLKPRLDLFGEPITRQGHGEGFWKHAAGIFTTGMKRDPLVEYLVANNAVWHPRQQPNDMHPDDFYEATKASGQALRVKLEAYRINPKNKGKTPDQIEDEIADIVSETWKAERAKYARTPGAAEGSQRIGI